MPDKHKSDDYSKMQSYADQKSSTTSIDLQIIIYYNNVCHLETVKSFEIISGVFVPLDVCRD